MFDELFQSLHEAVKKRNTPDSFIPPKTPHKKDVIHRGYLRKTGVPIKYDFIPDGKMPNSGTHVYNFKNNTTRALLAIQHGVKDPSKSGHETTSKISLEMMGDVPKDEPIQFYRAFVLPAFSHHIHSHKPEIVTLEPGIQFADDLMRRLGNNYEITQKNHYRWNLFHWDQKTRLKN